MTLHFPPTRTAALERLSAFVPKAGAYAAKRNYDLPDHPHVSVLSPYIRHRILTEEEVLQAVLVRYSPRTVEKFVQEVYWRTYWKGWLEMRPSVWTDYQVGVKAALNRLQTEAGLRANWETACKGETGIAPFDHWARDLVETGYLHNHARMWFASIWIFTLRLPWELGADFFLRNLLDGDPASNTLSWRWVGGLQTKGKTYLARSSNIAKYTEGRFSGVQELAEFAAPLDGSDHTVRTPIPTPDALRAAPTGLLLTEEDLSPGFVLETADTVASAAIISTAGRSPLSVSPGVTSFTNGVAAEALDRYAEKAGPSAGVLQEDEVLDWALSRSLKQIVTPYAPVGPAAQILARLRSDLAQRDIALVQIRRPYDSAAWPHATHGFFKFKEKIPSLLGQLRGLKAA